MSELGLAPVSARQTIQDGVYQRLSYALMTGRFDPGQTLTISSLSETFGTSHMPVREALRRLAAENALEIASTGSACVPVVTRARLDDLCRARMIVEGAATAAAAAYADAAFLRSLERIAADHVEAGRHESVPKMLAANQAFHFAIYRASASPVLVQLIETLWLRFGPYLRMLTRHMEPQLKTREIDSYTRHHYDIIAAFKAGDRASSRRHMEEDICSTQTLLQSLCPPGAEDGLISAA